MARIDGDDAVGAEIAALQAEADVPIEQLMAAYGGHGGGGGVSTGGDGGSSSYFDEEELDYKEEEVQYGGGDSEGIKFLTGSKYGGDYDKEEEEDEEFEMDEGRGEEDDETTLEEEERRAREEGGAGGGGDSGNEVGKRKDITYLLMFCRRVCYSRLMNWFSVVGACYCGMVI